MRFACPGGCEKSYPLEKGQLIIAHAERPKHQHGRFNLEPPTVAILCVPCTAKIIVARAKATT